MSTRRRSTAAMSRRGFGVSSVAAVAALAGCAEDPSPSTATPTAPGTGEEPSPPASLRPRSDEELALEAFTAERRMVDRLVAAVSQDSARATLTTARAVHESHVALLDEAAGGAGLTPAPTQPASPTASPPASPPATPPATPGDPAPTAAVTLLATAERNLAAQHTAAAVAASSGTFARVLAGMAAAAAQQAVVLDRLARQLRSPGGGS